MTDHNAVRDNLPLIIHPVFAETGGNFLFWQKITAILKLNSPDRSPCLMKDLLLILVFSLMMLTLIGMSLLGTWIAQLNIGLDEDQRACPGLTSQQVVDGVINNLLRKRETRGEWYLLSRDEIIINPVDVKIGKSDFFVPFHYTRKPGMVYDAMGGCAYPNSVEYAAGHPD